MEEVPHVIHADFPRTVVDFLHRVGRTARAGKSGLVTCLYGPDDKLLVDAVRAAQEGGLPVEEVRSFYHKKCSNSYNI